MSKFMQITGIVFAAIGVAVGFMVFFSPGQMQVVAVTPDVAVLLLVGGALCIGLGAVIAHLEAAADQVPVERAPAISPVAPASNEETVIPEFSRRLSKFMPPPKPEEDLSPSVRETITALENAKSDIDRALSDEPSDKIAAVEPVPEPEPEPEIEAEIEPAVVEELPEEDAGGRQAEDGDQLFVVEEKLIRGRSARVLSDGTVEAETDEGWMRFENIEHLDEYLEVMTPAAKD